MNYEHPQVLIHENILDMKEGQEGYSSHQSLRLTQTLLAAIYYLCFCIYVTYFTTKNNDITLMFSLSSLIVALLLGNLDIAFKVMPNVYMSAQIFPGALECISLALSVSWMVHSLAWIPSNTSTDMVVAISKDLLSIHLRKFLVFISFLNWISWTLSFIF